MNPESAAGKYLSTKDGKYVAGIFSDILKDPNISESKKGETFVEILGPTLAAQFYSNTGIPPMGSTASVNAEAGNVGLGKFNAKKDGTT